MTLRTGNGGKQRPQYPGKEIDDAVLTAVRSRLLDKDHLTILIFGLQRRERARSDSAIEEFGSKDTLRI
jgi:hypothetical protein